eukprot:TRINITY_DN69302_c0_g1_i1.p1 TRINITY_DN69302_c0_g1~~TRINITY_DN69302_c0_g1_i1.p1  ORF type:complete len:546 (-),score=53.31 TRINITY_DN69302_c0_g1_i1:660-2297(-)
MGADHTDRCGSAPKIMQISPVRMAPIPLPPEPRCQLRQRGYRRAVEKRAVKQGVGNAYAVVPALPLPSSRSHVPQRVQPASVSEQSRRRHAMHPGTSSDRSLLSATELDSDTTSSEVKTVKRSPARTSKNGNVNSIPLPSLQAPFEPNLQNSPSEGTCTPKTPVEERLAAERKWVRAAFARFGNSCCAGDAVEVITRGCAKWMALYCQTTSGAFRSFADLKSACLHLSMEADVAHIVALRLWTRWSKHGRLQFQALFSVLSEHLPLVVAESEADAASSYPNTCSPVCSVVSACGLASDHQRIHSSTTNKPQRLPALSGNVGPGARPKKTDTFPAPRPLSSACPPGEDQPSIALPPFRPSQLERSVQSSRGNGEKTVPLSVRFGASIYTRRCVARGAKPADDDLVAKYPTRIVGSISRGVAAADKENESHADKVSLGYESTLSSREDCEIAHVEATGRYLSLVFVHAERRHAACLEIGFQRYIQRLYARVASKSSSKVQMSNCSASISCVVSNGDTCSTTCAFASVAVSSGASVVRGDLGNTQPQQ